MNIILIYMCVFRWMFPLLFAWEFIQIYSSTNTQIYLLKFTMFLCQIDHVHVYMYCLLKWIEIFRMLMLFSKCQILIVIYRWLKIEKLKWKLHGRMRRAWQTERQTHIFMRLKFFPSWGIVNIDWQTDSGIDSIHF